MRVVIILFFLLTTATSVLADSLDVLIDFDQSEKTRQGNVALGVGASGNNLQLYGTLGLGNLAEEHPELEDQLLANVTGGVRLHAPIPWVKPFAGLSVRLGSISNEVPAENDDIDNDNDGAVDEDGEMEDIDLYSELTLFGELGARIKVSDPVAIIVDAKYPIFWSEGEREEWFYGFSLVLSIHDTDITPLPREEE